MCWCEVRALPRAKKAIFWSGDKEAYNTARARQKASIKEAKRRHQQRLERDLNINSTNDMWQVIQNVTGHKSRSAPFMCEATQQDELNAFSPPADGPVSVTGVGGCEKNLNSKVTSQWGLWLIPVHKKTPGFAATLCNWILDFQGCVLCPLLLTLCTNVC